MSSYDDVPYTSYPYARTHPDRLCTIATLFGMQPARPTGCRVLELGCAAGGNLLPMAELLPESDFVGLDASRCQIEDGRALLAEAGLTNVRLEHADILDVDADWGVFDYIICHGVYSWVSEDVQDKILSIMHDNLAPQGVGYVSYNVYPGWHMRETVRHMMRYHVRGIESPKQRAEQAGALIDFLAKNAPSEGSPYGALLRRELEILRGTSTDYLFHEHLEEVNSPVYFHELAERLERHDLAYLAETDVETMLLRQFSPSVARTLGRLATDIVSMEQYMDFVRNRQFRTTMLCHRSVPLRRNLEPSLVEGFSVEFAVADETPIDLTPGVTQELRVGEGLRVTSDRSVTKAAFTVLRRRWPHALAFERLFDEVVALSREAGLPLEGSARHDLASDLLACYFGGAGVRLHTWTPPLASSAAARPRAARVARAQAARGSFATSALHRTVQLDRATSAILRLLDGQRDRMQIVEALADAVERAELDLTRDGARVTDRAEMTELLEAVLEKTLAVFTRHGLLLA